MAKSTLSASADIAEQLDAIAAAELESIRAYLARLSDPECGAVLMEICRCMDHTQVMEHLSGFHSGYMPPPDFDLLKKGWNVTLALLLPRVTGLHAIPMAESGTETQTIAMSLMHAAGRHVMLAQTAERIRHGLITGRATSDGIELSIVEDALMDFFHDQLDHGRLADLRARYSLRDPELDDQAFARSIRTEMAEQTFLWELPQGVMVGYTTTSRIDRCFSDLLSDSALAWKDDGGIHHDAVLPGCNGADLMATIQVMLSFRLKHIVFVEEARKRFPDVNHHMSLTIWRTRREMIDNLVSAGSSPRTARAVIDLVTVRAADAPFFLREPAPSFPLLIEIADGYLLTPVSALFQNAFKQVRMLREASLPQLQNAVRLHRENWMAEDLCSLFQGDRFQRVPGQTLLRSKGAIVTDIDAAIFDWLTGELVLFQLRLRTH